MTAAMALVLSAAEGRAQTTEWTGAVSTDWSIPANWSSGLPTPASGTAEIDTDLPHPAVIDGSSVAARGVTIGLRGPARLEIRNGGVLSNTWGSIGVFSASNGSVVVAGSGSRWDASNVVTVAEYGIGTLEILGGAEAHLDGLLVGLDGGGPGRRGRGTVTVSGAGSLLTTNWPEIGVFGDYGILNVLDGGRVSVPTDAYVADIRRGEVAVRGAGSTFEIGGDLQTSWNSGGQANLTISEGGLLDVSGAIILPVHASGSAFLNIGAASGEAAAAPGLVEADGGILFGAGTGRVVFNHTGADYSFAPMLVGAGEIMVEAGRTRLTGDQSGFTGTTSVTGGALVVDSVLRGTLGVSQAGRLEGSGRVGNTAVASGGTIAPGNSIGTLTIDGDARFSPGSRYEVEVDPGGTASDLILVTGRAILDGGSVIHVGEAGTYRPRSKYRILSAAGGVEGRFDEVRSDFAFLDPHLSYGANDVDLTLERNDIAFARIAASDNQKAAAAALDALTFGDTVYDAVVVLDEPQARSAFEQLSGEIHASAKSALIGGSGAVRGIVEQRLRGTLGGGRPIGAIAAYASLDDAEDELPGEVTAADNGLWGRAFGSWARIRGKAGISGVQQDESGFLIGADRDVADAWTLPVAFDAFRLGAFGGYSRSNFALDARTSSGASENAHFGVYANAEIGALRMSGGVTHAEHRAGSLRRVVFPGFDERLTASYRARTTQLFAETGYRIPAGSLAFEPFVGLAYVRFDRDRYRERGGVAALDVSRDRQGSAFSTIGLRSFADFLLGDLQATAHGMIGWRHMLSGGSASAEVALAGTGPFRISGSSLERNAAIMEAGIDLGLSEGATLSVSYDGRQGARSAAHGVSARVHAAF